MRAFEGKVAVVTGAASGIGLGLATRFAQEGMKVVLADIEEPALEAAVTQLRRAEHDVLGVTTDVSKAESVEALARKTLDAYGKVHVLCNNAGVGGGFGIGIWEASLKDWQWTLGVNLWGVIHGVHTFLPIMLAQDEEGHVVNTASSAGLTPGNRVYGVSKHAVVALSEALYDGLRQRNAKVHASVLCPGVINTKIMYGARNRPEDLQDVAGAPPSEFEQQARDRIARLAQESGMDPLDAAGIVLDAIRNEQFWVLTHDDFYDIVRGRADDILARRNPTPRAPTPFQAARDSRDG
jgi:NAD(P)-dependent dehydrogenase (short-subunit alcohol dehydrogenase family)